jgi:hypothetical protein
MNSASLELERTPAHAGTADGSEDGADEAVETGEVGAG